VIAEAFLGIAVITGGSDATSPNATSSANNDADVTNIQSCENRFI